MTDVDALWCSDAVAARLGRALLLPAAGVFRASAALRNAMYDAGWLRSVDLAAPSLSVGNLSVGGTGKTPVSSWIASQLAARGARPAILLRGYGADEVRVHELLEPRAMVVAGADREQTAARAVAAGASVLVLDDAFQHRRARRDADIVLISADACGQSPWPLPAGPWREPLSALRRAQLVLVTRKAVGRDVAETQAEHIAAAAGDAPVGIVALIPDRLVELGTRATQDLAALAGSSVLAISGIGTPGAFEAQLKLAGAQIVAARYPDHYAFTREDAAVLARKGSQVQVTVCTLKDAVKLAPLWPSGAPRLWYLSQRVTMERGGESVTQLLDGLMAAGRTSSRLPAQRI